MTVVTSKDGRTATITVTSADELVKTVYTVHAHGAASDGGAGADDMGVTVDVGAAPVLAETGSDVRSPVTAMLVAFLTCPAGSSLPWRACGLAGDPHGPHSSGWGLLLCPARVGEWDRSVIVVVS